MPTYEYQCAKCGHQLEAFQKMSDAPLIDCPECQQPALTKLISGGGFQLKGTGWYVTDYSKKGKRSAEAKTGTETKTDKTDSKATSSGEATPVEKKSGGSSSNNSEAAS